MGSEAGRLGPDSGPMIQFSYPDAPTEDEPAPELPEPDHIPEPPEPSPS